MESSIAPLLPLFYRERAAGNALAVGVLIATQGSTYRKPGALMLMVANGEYAGLLSGGCLDWQPLTHLARCHAAHDPTAVGIVVASEWVDMPLGTIGLVESATAEQSCSGNSVAALPPRGSLSLQARAPRGEKLLAQLGQAARQICSRLHAPVGLPLGGRSPESVALAIVAQIHAFVFGAHRRRAEGDEDCCGSAAVRAAMEGQ